MKKGPVGLSVLLLALICASCSGAHFVDSVVVDNPTPFTVNVDVGGRARDDWISLTATPSYSETTVEQVIDQGDTWVFRFGYAGYEEELELSRNELERTGWRVEVPESFAATLRDRGVIPPP